MTQKYKKIVRHDGREVDVYLDGMVTAQLKGLADASNASLTKRLDGLCRGDSFVIEGILGGRVIYVLPGWTRLMACRLKKLINLVKSKFGGKSQALQNHSNLH